MLREHFAGFVGTTRLAYWRTFGDSKSLDSPARRAVPEVAGYEVVGNPAALLRHETLRASAR